MATYTQIKKWIHDQGIADVSGLPIGADGFDWSNTSGVYTITAWHPNLPPQPDDNTIEAANSVSVADAWYNNQQTRKNITTRNKIDLMEDFLNGVTPPFTVTSAGTGANTTAQAISHVNHPGIVRLTTGTTATGRTAIAIGTSALAVGAADMIFSCEINLTQLSTAGQRFAVLLGMFSNLTTVNQTQGVYWLYDSGGVSTGSSASTNLQTVTVRDGVRTFNTTNTPAATTWAELKIQINAAGNNVDFLVNNLVKASHTTNIPTGVSRPFGVGIMMIKNVGNTPVTLDLDLINLLITTNSIRL